jgi:hypothetical protein
MDTELKELLATVHCWSAEGINSVDWEDIYADLYAQDEAGLGADVERLERATEQRKLAKIDDQRQVKGEGGEERGYYFFLHPDFAGESAFRIVIRTTDQRTALRLMKLIVPEMVDAGGSFAGVHSAKVITGEAYAAGRKDLIVVYANNLDTQRAVSDRLLAWKVGGRFSDADFRDPLPVGIKRIARGIGAASQPPPIPVINGTGGVSYGKFLAQVSAIALRIAVRIHGTPLPWKEFKRVAEAVLWQAGVDAKFPDRIVRPSFVFAKLMPLASADADLPPAVVDKVKQLCMKG